MSVAPCLCLSAPSGPVGFAYTRPATTRLLRRKPAQQRPCYPAAVGQLKCSYETQVNQSPTFKSLLMTPKIVNALHAVTFHCWKDCDLPAELQGFWGQAFYDGLERQGLLPELGKLDLQEQAEVLSLAFIEAVKGAIMHRGEIISLQDCTQHNVEDLLSVATVAAAFQQVLLS